MPLEQVARTGDGKVWQAVSFLEGVAGLVGLLMLAEEVVDRGSVVLLIDNIGWVWAAINQSSRSLPVYSVVNAVLDIADRFGVKVADHLRKGELAQAGQLVELKEEKQMEVYKKMGHYLDNVKAIVYLGRSLLRELKTRVEVFLGVDFDSLYGDVLFLTEVGV